jgi:hypothetical protein
MDETSVGPLKPAGVEVEPSKVRFKIDVKPLAAGGFGVLGGLPHELTTNPGCWWLPRVLMFTRNP